MPRIIIKTENLIEPATTTLLDEHIATEALQSDHYAAQLIERIGWALLDADDAEGVKASA